MADPIRPDVLPEPVRLELDRVEQRWAALPLADAQQLLGRVHDSAQRILDLAATPSDDSRRVLPPVGPGSAVDQLRVVVFDLLVAPHPAPTAAAVLAELAGLRSRLGAAPR